VYNDIVNLYATVQANSDLNTGCNEPSIDIVERIDYLYNSIVGCLVTAADICVPRISPNCLKEWWSNQLTTLKNEATASHRLWENCGKPKTGDVYAKRTKQKLLYKNAIREAKKSADNKISSQLQESLLSKDCPSFW
jgi:hypothetical protein